MDLRVFVRVFVVFVVLAAAALAVNPQANHQAVLDEMRTPRIPQSPKCTAITLHLIRCVGRGARACPYAVAESVYAAANPQRSCVFQETSVIQGNGVIQGSFFLGADATSCDKGALVGNAFSGNVVNPKDWYETMGFKERGFAVRSFIVRSI
jgi:hypothetical protein